jgi:hypothetical protein
MKLVENYFGQYLSEGAYVGKGARDGNTSRESVGTIVNLIEMTQSHYGKDYTVVKARVRWDAHHTYSLERGNERLSTVHDARTLFLLDPDTIRLVFP